MIKLFSRNVDSATDDVAPKAAVAVFTRSRELAAAVSAACDCGGLKASLYENGSKLLRSSDSAPLLAVLWDARADAPDWEGLAALPAGAVVCILGGASPTPDETPFPLPVINIAPDAAPQAVGAAVAGLAGQLGTARRLANTEETLAETERRLAEAVQEARGLKEHVEFYELQRNQLSEVVRRTAYLGQLSKEINSLDIDRIFNICVTKVPKIVDATLASVYLHDAESGELILKQSNHPYRITDRVIVGAAPQSLMALAMERKATLLVRDMDAFALGARKAIDRSHAKKYATRSCMIVPLMNDNQVIAVLNLADKANGAPFDEVRDLPLVDHISQFIGIAMRNCQLYQEVWQLAKSDALTGFMNHNAFFDELHRAMARSQRSGASLALIILDVDNFKLFNDVHGHQVGDMILGQVAEIIRANVRTSDVPARYGGDEFAVILSDTDVDRAGIVAERIRRGIADNQLMLDGQNFFVTISAGVAQYRPGQSLSDIVNDADAALYNSKSRGRNTVSTCARV